MENILVVILVLALLTKICTSEDYCGDLDFLNCQDKLLQQNVENVYKACSEVCNTDIKPKSKGKYYNFIEKDFDCINLFKNPFLHEWKPVPGILRGRPQKYPPKWLKEFFKYSENVPMKISYMDDSHAPKYGSWTLELLEELRKAFEARKAGYGCYGIHAALDIDAALKNEMNITGKHVLVIGSQNPWLEVLLLNNGAAKITTVDYRKLESFEPKIEILTMEELAEKYLDGSLPLFDAFVSYSSIEHSGLGRYGDNINPWGDLITMARAWCLLKPGGLGLIGVPSGRDQVSFNSHRIYGNFLYSHLFSNWEQIHTDADFRHLDPEHDWRYQPLHVIKKPVQ